MDFSESAEVKTERKFDSREKCFDKFDKSGDGVNGTARGGARVYSTRAPAMDVATGKLGWVWEYGVPW